MYKNDLISQLPRKFNVEGNNNAVRTNQSPTIIEPRAITCSSLFISNKHLLVSVDSFISDLVRDTKTKCQGGEPT